MSAIGSGLSVGKWTVPLEVEKPLSSSLNSLITEAVGNRLQWSENAANHIRTFLRLRFCLFHAGNVTRTATTSPFSDHQILALLLVVHRDAFDLLALGIGSRHGDRAAFAVRRHDNSTASSWPAVFLCV
jgi:hypothetical protein